MAYKYMCAVNNRGCKWNNSKLFSAATCLFFAGLHSHTGTTIGMLRCEPISSNNNSCKANA